MRAPAIDSAVCGGNPYGRERRGIQVNFWDRLEAVSNERNVLRHPFYIRWSEGTLTREELAHYSGQYRHAVVALAAAAESAADSPDAGDDAAALARHAAEEASHVELWDKFVDAVGGRVDAEVTAATRECVSAWAGEPSRPLVETLAAMFAIESAQPAISATKQTGLVCHYGLAPSPYFDVHQELDMEHAQQTREMISRRLGAADEDALVASAERVLRANWRLLDGVEAACAHR
jgi:pyrroloquinoline-quinone synthase